MTSPSNAKGPPSGVDFIFSFQVDASVNIVVDDDEEHVRDVRKSIEREIESRLRGMSCDVVVEFTATERAR